MAAGLGDERQGGEGDEPQEGARCRSCGRAIVWTISPTGARLPVDARQVTVYHLDETGLTPRAVKAEQARPIFVSHYVTCPQASEWSRGGRS